MCATVSFVKLFALGFAAAPQRRIHGLNLTVSFSSFPPPFCLFHHPFLGRPLQVTVQPMISDRCTVCLSVCNMGVLWPNGYTDQDATWYGGRPRPRRHCVRWGPSSPMERGTSASQFAVARSHISAIAELLFSFLPSFSVRSLFRSRLFPPYPGTVLRDWTGRTPLKRSMLASNVNEVPCPCSPMVKPLGRHVQ